MRLDDLQYFAENEERNSLTTVLCRRRRVNWEGGRVVVWVNVTGCLGAIAAVSRLVECWFYFSSNELGE